MRIRTTHLSAVACAAGLALVLALPAAAARPAAPSERAAIASAWSGTPTTAPQARCLLIRVSTTNGRWAALRARITEACIEQAFNGSTFLKRTGSRWAVVIGGSSVTASDCALIPARVRADLPAFTRALGC